MLPGSVSVVIANYNRRSRLERAITSLLSQSLPAEVIVVDNGSTDGSADAASRFPGVIVLRNPRNHGFARATNQGIARATGEFVALLNNDAVMHPACLKHMRCCMMNPAIGMVAAKILLAADPRVSLFLMDYPGRRRLKILGESRIATAADAPDLLAQLMPTGYRARAERAYLIDVIGFDWNCPQHITARYTEAELAAALQPMARELTELRAELAQLRAIPSITSPEA